MKKPRVELVSFGFKYGRPFANFIFDVSFLKNPKLMNEWSQNIWHLTPAMKKYVLEQPKAQEFIKFALPFIRFISTQTDCVIGIGCTGGHHRSVSITEAIGDKLKKDYRVKIIHRDNKRYA